MIFKTLNSTYEIDDEAPRVRRVTGVNQPILGPDGEWRTFTDAIAWGTGVMFYFPSGSDVPWLRTSSVVDWDGKPGNPFEHGSAVADSSD